MTDGSTGRRLVRFGPFEFDPHSLDLRRRGRTVPLAPQPARVLRRLLAAEGQLVTRHELRRDLWSHETFVDFEAGLNYCLGRLRAVLGDHARKPVYIETLPRRGYRFIGHASLTGGAEHTLAVLPFDNIGRDPADDVVADGMADGLVTELGTVPGLRVLSRRSVLGFRRSTLRLPEIAERLGADTLVEGTVLRQHDRLRITAQLIEARPERELWADSCEGDACDVMHLLQRVTRAMAASVSAVLAPDATRPLAAGAASRPEYAPDAQRAFLEARFHLGKWTGADLERALRLLNESIALDPGHAPAHATLAFCLALLGYHGHVSSHVVYPQAKATAERAVQLDAACSLAHSSLGFVTLVHDWDFGSAARHLERAVDGGSRSDLALLTRGLFQLWILDDPDAALAGLDEALVGDPVSPFTNSIAAWLMLLARRHDDAEAQARRTLQMYPDAHLAATVLAWTRAAAGTLDESIEMFERAADVSGDSTTLGCLGHVYGLAGRRAEARGVLERLTGSTAGRAPAPSIAAVLAGLGEIEPAFEWIEHGIADRDAGLLSIRVSPQFAPLLPDPRLAAVAHRLGLSQ